MKQKHDTSTKRYALASFARKVGRMLVVMASLFLAGISMLVGLLRLLSRGKPKPFVDERGRPLPGSISEKVFVPINGVQQGMFIKSKDDRNPVLLYLHGGLSDYFLTRRYPTGLENYFTVVWWNSAGRASPTTPTSRQRR